MGRTGGYGDVGFRPAGEVAMRRFARRHAGSFSGRKLPLPTYEELDNGELLAKITFPAGREVTTLIPARQWSWKPDATTQPGATWQEKQRRPPNPLKRRKRRKHG